MSDTCVGVSWETEGAHVVRATVSPVEEFPLSHPAALDPNTKTCLGLGAGADAETFALPASGRSWDFETGACSLARLTGGELLFNPGGNTGSSFANLGKSRTSRAVVARDAGGVSYLVLVNGARGDASGGRVGVEIAGRDLADGSSRSNNAGNTRATLLHPKTPTVTSAVGACSLNSASAEDCFAFDSVNGQAALRWAWDARAPEGAVLGPFPGTGACVSMRWELGVGVDAVEIGSYDNATGAVTWTDVTAAAV